jgi:hypothetical protein
MDRAKPVLRSHGGGVSTNAPTTARDLPPAHVTIRGLTKRFGWPPIVQTPVGG